MSIIVPFSKSFKYPNQDIQWIINYKPKIKELDDFISKNQNHRVTLYISDYDMEKDDEIFQALFEKYKESQLVLCFPLFDVELQNHLTKNGFPHYYENTIITWEDFIWFLSLNITDIFIGETVAFDIIQASKMAREKNKRLGVCCNFCDSPDNQAVPSLKKFFIRPEDFELYSNYVDVFKFTASSANEINLLYEIYTKDKKWFGKLSEIIKNYTSDEDSRFIIPKFAQKRLSCGRRCLINPGQCKICDRISELSYTMKNHDIMVSY